MPEYEADYLNENDEGQATENLAAEVVEALSDYFAADVQCETFASAGVVTTAAAGVVLRLPDGTEYQMTLVRSA